MQDEKILLPANPAGVALATLVPSFIFQTQQQYSSKTWKIFYYVRFSLWSVGFERVCSEPGHVGSGPVPVRTLPLHPQIDPSHSRLCQFCKSLQSALVLHADLDVALVSHSILLDF